MRWFALVAWIAATAGAARADMSLPRGPGAGARDGAGIGAGSAGGGAGDCGATLEAARKRAAAIEPAFAGARVRVTPNAPNRWDLLVQAHGGNYLGISIFPFYEERLRYRDWTSFNDDDRDDDRAIYILRDSAALERRVVMASTGWDGHLTLVRAIFRAAADECLR
jgi:hypothetical protein